MNLRIAVIGTGLIGGSILLRLRDKGFDVIGWDPDAATAQHASRLGLPFTTRINEALRERDVAFLAAPQAALPACVVEAAKWSPDGCVLTDVGVAKLGLAEHAVRNGAGDRFVPGHPLVHGPGVGIWAASASLLERCAWVLCPSAGALEGFRRVAGILITAFGARIVPAPPSLHDVVVAMASGVAEVPASVAKASLVVRSRLRTALLRLAVAGSHGDNLRVRGTPSQWAADVLDESREALRARLEMLSDTLDELLVAIDDEERGARLLSEVRLIRREADERLLATREVCFTAAERKEELDFLTAIGAAGGYVTRCEEGVSGVTYTALHTPGG